MGSTICRALVLIFSLLLSLATCVSANTIDTLGIIFKCDTLRCTAKVDSVYSTAMSLWAKYYCFGFLL